MAIYCNSNVNETRTLLSGPGFLKRVVINDLGAAGSFITIYDNTAGSGTKLATITCPATVGNPFTLTYDVGFSTGLTTTTSGATDVTLAFR